MSEGYSILTWKMRLFCPNEEWLPKTEACYREVLNFYFRLLITREELWKESGFTIQRELERLTIAGRDGHQPEVPLPIEKVPVYFRRSAINKAIASVKSILALNSGKDTAPQFPEEIEASVTFFKGMYQELEETKVSLKLWDGQKWHWTKCNLSGRAFPREGILLSPTLVREDKWYMLHIPVKQENSDARTAKARMGQGTKLGCVRFTNTDVIAMCAVLTPQGKLCGVHTCRGGDEYRHHCRRLLDKIQKSRVFTDRDEVSKPNKKYYMHLKHLSEHYAHQTSREIIDFCLGKGAGIIALPAYEENFSKISMQRSGNFSPLHLSSRIRAFLEYKAWAEGILVLEVNAAGISSRCAQCGAPVKKKGKQFLCENGHQGNRFLNEAQNLGQKCQESFRKNGANFD